MWRTLKKSTESIRNAVRRSLPSWALVGLSFIWGSDSDTGTDTRQKPQLSATMQVIMVREIKQFDVFESAIGTRHNEEDKWTMKFINSKTSIRHAEPCETSSSSKAAKKVARDGERSQTSTKELQDRTIEKFSCCWYVPDQSRARGEEGQREGQNDK